MMTALPIKGWVVALLNESIKGVHVEVGDDVTLVTKNSAS